VIRLRKGITSDLCPLLAVMAISNNAYFAPTLSRAVRGPSAVGVPRPEPIGAERITISLWRGYPLEAQRELLIQATPKAEEFD